MMKKNIAEEVSFSVYTTIGLAASIVEPKVYKKKVLLEIVLTL